MQFSPFPRTKHIPVIQPVLDPPAFRRACQNTALPSACQARAAAKEITSISLRLSKSSPSSHHPHSWSSWKLALEKTGLILSRQPSCFSQRVAARSLVLAQSRQTCIGFSWLFKHTYIVPLPTSSAIFLKWEQKIRRVPKKLPGPETHEQHTSPGHITILLVQVSNQ